jgi:hypothetical protein
VSVPATRSLTAVLRRAMLDGKPGVRLLIGQIGAADPSAAYCNVILSGTTMRVPMLKGVPDTPGAAAYLLATEDFLLCIGTVSE